MSRPAPAWDSSLDLLRAVMVLYIVGFWHLLGYTKLPVPLYDNWLTQNLTTMVLGSFVLISGLLLGRSGDKLAGFRGVGRFYLRRLRRIYPLYALALLAFTLVGLANPWDALKAALLVSMFVPEPPMTLWFITMLMSFYLVAPALIRCGDRTFVGRFLGIFAAILAFDTWINPVDTRIITYYPAFGLGIMLGRNPDWASRLSTPMTWLKASLPCAISGISLTLFKTNVPIWDALLSVLWAMSGPLLLWGISTRYGTALGNYAPIRWLGYASYCMYLFHRVIFWLAQKLVPPVIYSEFTAYVLIMGLLITIIISWLTQTVYDRCLNRLTQRG